MNRSYALKINGTQYTVAISPGSAGDIAKLYADGRKLYTTAGKTDDDILYNMSHWITEQLQPEDKIGDKR